jgi:uncharacterized ferredoxin-like protein
MVCTELVTTDETHDWGSFVATCDGYIFGLSIGVSAGGGVAYQKSLATDVEIEYVFGIAASVTGLDLSL